MEKQHQQSSGHYGQDETNENQDTSAEEKDEEKSPDQIHDDRIFRFRTGLRA